MLRPYRAGARSAFRPERFREPAARSPFGEAAVLLSPDRVAPAMAILVDLAHRRLVDGDAEARPLRDRQMAIDRGENVRIGEELEQVVADVIVDAERHLLDG